jgi:hypothetical protein
MDQYTNFPIAFDFEGNRFTGKAVGIFEGDKDGVPRKFYIELHEPRVKFLIEYTEQGWRSEWLKIKQGAVDAIGEFMILHFE